MTYALNLTNKTMDEVYTNLGAVVPSFWPLVLLFEFMIILIVGAFANKRFTGYTNIMAWMCFSSFLTVISAVILNLVAGLISIQVIAIAVVLSIVSGMVAFAIEHSDNSA